MLAILTHLKPLRRRFGPLIFFCLLILNFLVRYCGSNFVFSDFCGKNFPECQCFGNLAKKSYVAILTHLRPLRRSSEPLICFCLLILGFRYSGLQVLWNQFCIWRFLLGKKTFRMLILVINVKKAYFSYFNSFKTPAKEVWTLDIFLLANSELIVRYYGSNFVFGEFCCEKKPSKC